MCQIKTCICFLFSQPIIGCSLLRGKFHPKYLCGAQKKVSVKALYSIHYIEDFLWEFDRDPAGSLKKCPLLPGVHYRQVWL